MTKTSLKVKPSMYATKTITTTTNSANLTIPQGFPRDPIRWGVFYIKEDSQTFVSIHAYDDNYTPLCREHRLFAMELIGTPEVPCDSCYRLKIIRELGE